MPTYEYGCGACGHQWELWERISAKPAKKCPQCGKMKAQRLISGGNFILKGDGWYADLYHKPAAKKAEDTSGSTSEAKADAKPEKKAEKDSGSSASKAA